MADDPVMGEVGQQGSGGRCGPVRAAVVDDQHLGPVESTAPASTAASKRFTPSASRWASLKAGTTMVSSGVMVLGGRTLGGWAAEGRSPAGST